MTTESTATADRDIAEMRNTIRQAANDDHRVRIHRGHDDIDEPSITGDIEILWDGGGKTAARLHSPHDRTYRITLITVDGSREATAGLINSDTELLDRRPIHEVEIVEDDRQTVDEMHTLLRQSIGERVRVQSVQGHSTQGVLYHSISNVETVCGLVFAEDADPDHDDARAVVKTDRPESSATVWMQEWPPRRNIGLQSVELRED